MLTFRSIRVIQMSMGFRVISGISRLPESDITQFENFAVANVGDAMGRFGIMNHRIKPINNPGVQLVGSAITVRTRAADNLMIHMALNVAQAGDVIVVEVQGSPLNGLWGGLMTAAAIEKGLAGVVIDGGIRDMAEIRDSGFPVFTRAIIAAGGDKEGPGEVNVPISCGGVPVSPGDIIIGDEDGVAVVPKAEAKEVLERVVTIKALEEKKLKATERGEIDRSWVEKALVEKECEFL